MRHSPRTTPAALGFTLIELLVCIAIISLLVAMLMPALARARDRAKLAVCVSNLRECATAALTQAQENNNVLLSAFGSPTYDATGAQWGLVWWYGAIRNTSANPHVMQFSVQQGTLGPYLHSSRIVTCPMAPTEMRSYWYQDINPNSPCPVSPYAMNENAGSLKIGSLQNASDVSMFNESATITMSAASDGYTMTSPVEFMSTSQCYSLIPNFMGRHNGKGPVAWCDGHATIETPYMVDPANLTKAANIGEATYAVKNASLGFITPVPQTESYADFVRDARMNQWCVQDGESWVLQANN